jgi:cytidine deaminase
LVIGIVGAVGTDLSAVSGALVEALQAEVDYAAVPIRLSNLLHEIEGLKTEPTPNATEEVRYKQHMKAGTELRTTLKRGDAVALLGVRAIVELRKRMVKATPPKPRRAFILHSLKRREEAALLRHVYGASFYLVAAYSPREHRVTNLASRISRSYFQARARDYRKHAEELIVLDEKERLESLGQNVEAVFPEADAFLDATNPSQLRNDVRRLIRLIFGDLFVTPTRDEQGMFFAKAAALRSAALGRQVGAAISTADGQILVTGTNEVPKAHGGLYWEGDSKDERDFVKLNDVSDQHKRDVLGEALTRLNDSKWLSEPFNAMKGPDLVKRALGETDDSDGPLKGSRMMDSLEFMRPVHAEMAAICEAARRGISVEGKTAFVTTFPCHGCARHLIAAGLARIVYIDPYPKSLAAELHGDSIAIEGSKADQNHIPFEPFIGVAPRRYLDFFELRKERKTSDGKIVQLNGQTATPKLSSDFLSYNETEVGEIHRYQNQMALVGLSERKPSKRKGETKRA